MRRRLYWLAAALVALSACEKQESLPVEMPEPAQPEDPWLLKDLSGNAVPLPGGTATLSANFGETRSHIEMNGAGTYAGVVWDAGDSFRMYAFSFSDGRYQQSTFTTQDGGAPADFSGSGFSFAGPYHALYPLAGKVGMSDGKALLGLEVPKNQTAVPGGMDKGLGVSYAFTPSLDQDVSFQPLLSPVRFRLSGELVPRVREVTLRSPHYVSGNAIFVADGDGTGTLTTSRSFSGDEHYTTVTLDGTFTAGTDYYLVLLPGGEDTFQLVFSDGEGHSTTKYCSAYAFPYGRITDFGTIDLGSEFTDETVDTTPVQYMKASAGAPKPVTLAVIPEGFTAAQLSQYEMLAKSGIDVLMGTEPFKTYKDYFNVWILKVASAESGASVTDGNGNVTERHNSYFGAKWGKDSYGDMSANGNDVFGFVSENCPDIKDGTHGISEVPVLMIINDTRYGGICFSYSDGKSYSMVPYAYSGERITWAYSNIEAASATAVPQEIRTVTEAERDEMGRSAGDWRNTLVHEFGGHGFTRLGDEYWGTSYNTSPGDISSHSWDAPFKMNLSGHYENVPWESLLGEDRTVRADLVQRDARYGRIGLYQGGDNSLFNRWRSERISVMIDNRCYFSTWQRILAVQRIMALSGSTFNMDAFWAKDVTIDPLRDGAAASAMAKEPLPLREMPMLPPPVLVKE